jgi:hypothetical protein
VAKPGKPLLIRVYPNEALNGGYTGFHRWNFANVKGKLVLHSKYLERPLDVREELRGLVHSIHCDRGSVAPDAFSLGASAVIAKRYVCPPSEHAQAQAERLRQRICGERGAACADEDKWDDLGRIVCTLWKARREGAAPSAANASTTLSGIWRGNG